MYCEAQLMCCSGGKVSECEEETLASSYLSPSSYLVLFKISALNIAVCTSRGQKSVSKSRTALPDIISQGK